jgi:opacity protein-like surface antigen
MRKIRLFAILAVVLATPARAVDGIALEAGTGNQGVSLLRAGLQWNWDRRWLEAGGWHLGGYWDASLGVWGGGPKNVADFGLTPTFRYQRSATGSPYVEAAIGVHLLSSVHVAQTRTFGTRFQFGDHIGVGMRFGPDGQYDLSLRLQHASNAGIREPNPGINFLILRLQVPFD